MSAELTGNEREAEVARVMQICNACRYCETYCAVFPAMTRRLQFDAATSHYLANLCHNCGACLHACQYAPPHEFGVNVPVAMARVRKTTYEQYAWPGALAAAFRRSGTVTLIACVVWIAVFMLLAHRSYGSGKPGAAAGIYQVYSHTLMTAIFAPLFILAVLALAVGVVRFWRDQAPGPIAFSPAVDAGGKALRLTYLGGGHGEGCNEEADRFTNSRRIFHHLLFYGFLSCFAATSVATLYHYLLNRVAPYELSSLPVILGVVGGLGMMAGACGLLVLNLRRNARHRAPEQMTFDRAFSLLLLLTALSGMGVWALTSTSLFADVVAVHLGLVAALFCTMPYGKFAHGAYRAAALLKWAIERRMPSGVKIASD